MEVFVFGSFKKSDNYRVIGKGGDFPSLENYLKNYKNFKDFEFTKNHLDIEYFSDEAVFISDEHQSPLQLRLQEPTIPRGALVVTSSTDVEEILSNREDYLDDDYDIFSGDKILTEFKETKLEILKNIINMSNVFYQYLEAGYFNLKNEKRVDDWTITFQEPLFDLLVRYFRLTSSAPDISFFDEFINNPYLRKNICEILMKVMANFLVNNKYLKKEKVKEFKTWENLDLWYTLREELKILKS